MICPQEEGSRFPWSSHWRASPSARTPPCSTSSLPPRLSAVASTYSTASSTMASRSTSRPTSGRRLRSAARATAPPTGPTSPTGPPPARDPDEDATDDSTRLRPVFSGMLAGDVHMTSEQSANTELRDGLRQALALSSIAPSLIDSVVDRI